MKKDEVYVSEIYPDKLCKILFSNNILTLSQLADTLIKNKKINNLEGLDRNNVINILNKFLKGEIKLKRTEIPDKYKNIKLIELDLENNIHRNLMKLNINTIEDLHIAIERNIIDYMNYIGTNPVVIKAELDSVINKFFKLLTNQYELKRLFTDEELEISKKLGYFKISELDFSLRVKTILRYSYVYTVEELTNSLLSGRKFSFLEEDYTEIIITELKNFLDKYTTERTTHKLF